MSYGTGRFARSMLGPYAEAGFKALDALSDEAFGKLHEVLCRPQARLDGGELKALFCEVTGLEPDLAGNLLFATLRLIDDDAGPLPIRTVIDELYPPPKDAADDGKIVAAKRDVLRSRLLALQDCKNLLAFSKAANLLVRNERNFASAKTITDLRPAFDEDVDASPLAYVIQHQIEIKFREGITGDYKSFFVSADERDIDDLIAVLQRSKDKANSLKRQLEELHLPYLTHNRLLE
jgi:hypothetical protein